MQSAYRIKICQFIYGDLIDSDSWFNKFVAPINRCYCEIHGYEYIVDRLDQVQQDRHGNWEKVSCIKRHLHDCDYLLIMDADACFYSHTISIEEELLPYMEWRHLMLISADIGCETSKWNPAFANAGIILLRNLPETLDIVNEWDTATDTQQYDYMKFQWPLEQECFNVYIEPRYTDRIKKLADYYLMNGNKGQFIRHLVAFSNEQRRMEFGRIFNSGMMARNRYLLNMNK